MSFPEKKTKTKTKTTTKETLLNPSATTQSTPNPSLPLPLDLQLNCLARVSRSYYPTLSLVSKTFQSLIVSPELYKTRSLQNRTETCLYVCLDLPHDNNLHWFTLCKKPRSRRLTKNACSNVLVPVLYPQSLPPVHSSSFVATGCAIYRTDGLLPTSKLLWWYKGGEFKWFDTKVKEWRVLKGMNGQLPKLGKSWDVQMVDNGVKMVVLWHMHDLSSSDKGKVIWCAEIVLERCNSEEISGKVEWYENVLKVPELFRFMGVLVATV